MAQCFQGVMLFNSREHIAGTHANSWALLSYKVHDIELDISAYQTSLPSRCRISDDATALVHFIHAAFSFLFKVLND